MWSNPLTQTQALGLVLPWDSRAEPVDEVCALAHIGSSPLPLPGSHEPGTARPLPVSGSRFIPGGDWSIHVENQVFVLPAQPGWFALVKHPTESGLLKDPILAWRVDIGRKPYVKDDTQTIEPILAFRDKDDVLGLMHPSGAIEDGGNVFTAIEDFQKHLKRFDLL